jgi:hypothetical protein
MKKVLLVLAVLGSYVSYAQTAKVEQYCDIMSVGKLFSNKVKVTIDKGEFQSIWKPESMLKDENGNPIVFNTTIDALNFMGKNGWKLVNAFPITEGGTNVYHFFFKKEADISELK